MTINSAMLSGVSGLVANSAALASISDNIANVNTIAYKRNDTSFQSLVTAASGGQYNAGGVLSITQQQNSQQGQLQQTASSTDLGIYGSGYFITTKQATNVSPVDARIFTRAGSFQVDSAGYLRNASGYYLQGWPVDQLGNINVDPSDLTRLASINVGAVGGAADPTTQVSINANLDTSQPISAAATAAALVPPGAGAYDPATNNMASYDPVANTGVKPDFSLQIPISDSQGTQRTFEVDFLKSTTPNQWYAEIRAVGNNQVQTTPPLANGQVATGIVAFDPAGKIDMSKTTLFGGPPSPANPTIDLGASAGPAGANGQWDPSLGIAAQQIAISIDTAPGGLTQDDAESATQSISTNGTAFGNLTNIEIDTKGNVTAIYDNGVTRRIAQVAVATFPNPDGLKAISGNGYQVTQESGTYNLKPPGSGGAGVLSPSTLEASTVDLSTELTGLITTQSAYSASSKIITTADQMLQTLIDVIR
jgi:flagellar hook protein FlgE